MTNHLPKCKGDGCQGCVACASCDGTVTTDKAVSLDCPLCHSLQHGPIEDGYRHWECESFAHASGECFEESKLCSLRQRMDRLLAVAKAAVIAFGSDTECDAINCLGALVANELYPPRKPREPGPGGA